MKKHLIIILAVAVVLAACTGKPKANDPNGKQEPKKTVVVPQFNADSAYQYVAMQTQFGPRVPETEAHAACAEWLAAKLSESADTVIVQNFRTRLYDGRGIDGKNLIGSFNPEAKNITAGKHELRPIPQAFIDALQNSDGTNLSDEQKKAWQNPGY